MAMIDTRLMSMRVHEGEARYHSSGWRDFFESYIPAIRQSERVHTVLVDELDRYKYTGDFYGLLLHKKVEVKYHWCVLRLNGMVSPSDFNEEMSTIFFPDIPLIVELMALYNNRSKKMA